MWMGGRSRGGGGVQQLRGPITTGPALGPDGLQSDCTGGPEATGWGVEGEESEREGGARLFRALEVMSNTLKSILNLPGSQ